METFLALPEDRKQRIYEETSQELGLQKPLIVEKDFWVCWVLHQLFSAEELREHLTFKGGTSLSKAYSVIDRFSEDIDLTIGKNAPFLIDVADPMEGGISGKERGRRIDSLKANAQSFVTEFAFPVLEQKIKDTLGYYGEWNLTLDEGDNDKQTILFHYPKVMNYKRALTRLGLSGAPMAENRDGYIKPIVKLEFGARGEIEPSASRTVTPYVAESFPELFKAPASNVHVLAIERTFWEKVTILHALYHGKKMRDRMSRHYYDTYMLVQKGVADATLNDHELLARVVHNKSLMFKDNKASYETAVPGSLRLVPDKEKQAELKQDYQAMNEMFMTDVQPFEEIVDTLAKLEARLNQPS